MKKSSTHTRKLFLWIAIFIGSVSFTTQANSNDPRDLFLDCKDTSQSVDKSLRDVVINTVKAADLFLELGKLVVGEYMDYLEADLFISDRGCAMENLEFIEGQLGRASIGSQVTDFNSALKGVSGALDPSEGLYITIPVGNGIGHSFHHVAPRTNSEFCYLRKGYKLQLKCDKLRDQFLKNPKYSLEQTLHSKTWTQDFLGGITDIKRIYFYARGKVAFYILYVVTHKSNPDSAYVFFISSRKKK